MERNSTGEYISGDHYCHTLLLGDTEVPAAKRPATVTYPEPAINHRTPIVWRPVDPAVKITVDGSPG
jgi:hypothetical protein